MTMTATPARVKCGNRAHGTDTVYHASADEVRACYTATGTGSAPDLAAFKRGVDTPPTPERYQAGLDQAARTARYAAWRTIPVYVANRGYYALKGKDQVKFFRVERPTKGKYKGMTFVTMQSGDNFERIPQNQAYYALDHIAKDPETAARLYGTEIERCARCNRTLTDDLHTGSDGLTSRERGIGPECAKKYGSA